MNRTRGELIVVQGGLLLLAFFSMQCFNKPPDSVAPQWDVGLTMPVSDRTYTLADIVAKDSSILNVVPGGTQLMYKSTIQATPTYVGDLITLDAFNSTSSAQLGPIAISPATVVLPIPLSGLLPGFPLPPVDSTAVPGIDGFAKGFSSVTFKSGTLSLKLNNYLPATITIKSPIVLIDSLGRTMGSFFVWGDTIPPYGALARTASLAGRTMTRKIRFTNMSFSEPGSVLTVPGGDLLGATLDASNLLASDAVLATIPPQMLVDNATTRLPLTDSTRIRDAKLKSGVMNIHFVSHLNLDSFFKFRFTQLFTPAGNMLVDSVNLSANGTADRSINLANFWIASGSQNLLSSLDLISSVNVYQGSAGQSVLVKETDNVAITTAISQIRVDSANCVIRPTLLAVDQRVKLNFGDLSGKFKGQLHFSTADLQFTPASKIGFPLALNLRLEAKRAGSSVPEVLVVPVGKVSNGTESIVFPPGDVARFLSDLSESFPDSMRVVGNVVVNPNYDTTAIGSVGRNSSFGGTLELGIPLSLSIVGGTFADTSTFGDTTGTGKGGKKIDEKSMNDFNYGRMYVEVDNGLPVQLSIKVALLDQAKKSLLEIPQSVGDSVRVASGVVANGDVQASSHSSSVIELKGFEVRQFNPAQFVKYAIALSTPGGQEVNLRSTDRVRVRIWSQFSYRVNP